MQPPERRLLLDQLTSSEAKLLQLVDGLTPEQWSFRETPERWSIADNLEHLIVFERFIMDAIARVLEVPPEPAKKGAGRGEGASCSRSGAGGEDQA